MITTSILCFVAAVIVMVKRSQMRRTQAVLMLIAGAGIAGRIGDLRDYFTERGGQVGATSSDRLFGYGVPYIFAVVVVMWWFFSMDLDGLINKLRKKGKGSGRHSTTAFTPWLSLLVIPCLAVLPFVGGIGPEIKRLGDELSADFKSSTR